MTAADTHPDDAVAMTVRYQIADARFRPIEGRQGYTATEIDSALTMSDGSALFFNSLFVKRGMSPPLVADFENDEFFRAVVLREDDVLDIDPALLDALRRYVLDGDDGLFSAFPTIPYYLLPRCAPVTS